MTDQLAVWLAGVRVALVEKDRKSRFRVRLRYTPEALDAFPLGIPLLSLRFPLTPEPFGPAVSTAFLENLLPEGAALYELAARFGVAAQDVYALLAALGRDSAGALVIQPDDDPPPARDPTAPTTESLTDVELLALIRGVPRDPLGVGPRVRLSLAGLQGKLLLTQLPNGGWSQPLDGTPSTHIVKVPILGKPDSVQNEAFCLRLAQSVCLPVPESELLTIEDATVLFVRRYDRRMRDDGVIERVHQEDCCQAFGRPASQKYQQAGGPSLRAIAALLREHDPDALLRLLDVMVFNVVIGNADAHAKNLSLLHPRPDSVRLAPFYDLLATRLYSDADDRLAMRVADVQRIDRVTRDHLIAEIRTWGVTGADAETRVSGVLQRIPEAIEKASAEVPNVPSALPMLLTERLARLQSSDQTRELRE
jgi:serine/threonine-protein kinase HipA